MYVDCEFYGTVSEAVGSKRPSLEVAAGTTVREALEAVEDEFDGVRPILFDAKDRIRLTVAVP